MGRPARGASGAGPDVLIENFRPGVMARLGLGARTRTRRVAEWQAILEAHDVPHAPVLGVREARSHPHARSREMVVEVQHESLGAVRVLGHPIRFPGSPQAPLAAPPLLGQHMADILRRELNYSEEAIRALRERGIIDRGTGK